MLLSVKRCKSRGQSFYGLQATLYGPAWVGEGSEPLPLSPGLVGLFVSRLHVREAVIVGLQMLLRVGRARRTRGADVCDAGEVLLRQAGLAVWCSRRKCLWFWCRFLVTAAAILLSWSYAKGRYIYRGAYIVGVHLLETHGNNLCGPSTRGWADDMIFILWPRWSWHRIGIMTSTPDCRK